MEINELDLETLKETFRLEIRKELKIKEGAEKLQKASYDRKSKAYVATILKNCNEKLDQLHSELSALQAQVPDDDGKSCHSHNLKLDVLYEMLVKLCLVFKYQ